MAMAVAMAMSVMSAQGPARSEAHVLLGDGRAVVLREILESDGPALRAFHDGLSDASVRNRFFSPHPHLTDAETRRFTQVDRHRRDAVVAVTGRRIVGVGRFEPTDVAGTAELGLVVAEDHQGVGLGAALLRAVAKAAGREGYGTLVADVLEANARMLRLLVGCGLRRTITHAGGVTTVALDLDGPR